MEKRWLIITSMVILIILTAITMLSITETTGSAIYGKCWKINDELPQGVELGLKAKGCIIENSRVCCPFEACPEAQGISCS